MVGPGGLPPLNISSGPAVSEAGGSGGQSTTGEFVFGRKRGWADLAAELGPYAIGGFVLWMVFRRK